VSIVALAAEGSSYETPGVQEFWQPLIGHGAWAVTRTSFLALISVALLSWALLAGTRKLSVVPSKGQALTEVFYGLVRGSLGRDVIGSKDFLRFMPLLFTLFMMVLLNNVFSIIPFIQFPTMSRVAFPAVLAVVVFFVYHYIGMQKHGFFGYFKSLVPSGLPAGLVPAIFVLELITDIFTRPVTLALRLFGNMFAGHLLLILFITGGEYMVAHGAPFIKIAGGGSLIMGFVMTIFELLVQVLQAYIFALLAAIYIAGALADEH
jgi:F-type H+-transporting ATPase subunit a